MRLILLWGCLLLPGSRALTGPKEISGFEGDTVTLQCSYKEEMKEYLKYWCKSAGIFIRRCSNTIYSREDGREVTSGRVSIQDSPQYLTFTVTLRDLTLEDKGKYWCGIQQLGFDHTFTVSLIVFPGSSRLATQQDSTLTKHTSSSKSRMSVPMIRILSPVLVLLGLLLAASMIVLGSCVLRHRKKEAHLSQETASQKVHLTHLMPGNGWTSEYAVINRAGASEPTGPCASQEPSAPPNTEIHCLSQTTEEEEAAFQDPQGDEVCMSSYHLPGEEPYFSDFIPV